jgi:predicted Rossmann fold flavoprotein
MKIGIFGAGPAGIFAALNVRNVIMNDIYLFDANPRIGKKFSVTGSGRCNITNLNIQSDAYFSFQPANLKKIFDRYSPIHVRNILDELGIPTVTTDDGWVYPQSYSANNVVQILRDHLDSRGIHIIEDTKVISVENRNNEFILTVDNQQKKFHFDRLVAATGGKAYPQLRADTSILKDFEKMGIQTVPFRPALVPVELSEKTFQPIAGIRMDAEIQLFENNLLIRKNIGNIIFTDFGLNGPGIMNLSHLIDPNNEKNFSVIINFLPESNRKQIENLFEKTRKTPFHYRSIFLSLLPEKVVDFFFNRWKLPENTICSDIPIKNMHAHLKDMQSIRVGIHTVKGYKFAQASAGGILLSEIDLDTMQSKKIPGLFFAGEILDVTGPCGGYNLHWAITSGIIAGESINAQAD